MRINTEEVFGPVVHGQGQGFTRKSEIANCALAGRIVTNSPRRTRGSDGGSAGMIMVNLPTAGVDYHVPFGGTRKSSYGAREQGFAAIEFYTQTKTVYIGG
jgi:aldehyde dehydrogenase (NAD+)